MVLNECLVSIMLKLYTGKVSAAYLICSAPCVFLFFQLLQTNKKTCHSFMVARNGSGRAGLHAPLAQLYANLLH